MSKQPRYFYSLTLVVLSIAMMGMLACTPQSSSSMKGSCDTCMAKENKCGSEKKCGDKKCGADKKCGDEEKCGADKKCGDETKCGTDKKCE